MGRFFIGELDCRAQERLSKHPHFVGTRPAAALVVDNLELHAFAAFQNILAGNATDVHEQDSPKPTAVERQKIDWFTVRCL